MILKELEQIASELKKSPMFQLSLSSKELFHSNFLYWIWKSSPQIFRNIIEQIYGTINKNNQKEPLIWPIEFDVKREYLHYDLCIVDKSNERPFLIIENKIKSIPRKDQLNRYKKENEKAICILLSLVTDFVGKKEVEKDWIIIDYSKYSQIIRKVYQSNNPYFSTIVEDYCTMVNTLQSISNTWKISDSLKFNEQSSDLVKSLRIDDLHQKLRYSGMLERILEKIQNEFEWPEEKFIFGKNTGDILLGEKIGKNKRNKDTITPSFSEIYVGTGMSNAQGYFELKIKVDDKTLFTIQVQGNQYRRAIERVTEKNENFKTNISWLKGKESCLHKFFATDGDTLKYPEYGYATAFGIQSPYRSNSKDGQDGFCRFGDWFIYQYVLINDVYIHELIDGVITDIKTVLKLQH